MASPRKGVPTGPDADLDEEKEHKKLRVEQAPVALEVSVFRQLLQEQADGFLASNKAQLDQAVSRMEEKQKLMFQTLHGRIDQATAKIETVETKVDDFEKRLSQLEQGTSTRAGSDMSTQGRQTLVFGGWPPESRRQVILQELGKALDLANVRPMLDDDPFCTGASFPGPEKTPGWSNAGCFRLSRPSMRASSPTVLGRRYGSPLVGPSLRG